MMCDFDDPEPPMPCDYQSWSMVRCQTGQPPCTVCIMNITRDDNQHSDTLDVVQNTPSSSRYISYRQIENDSDCNESNIGGEEGVMNIN